MKRNASAQWKGGLKEGSGELTTESTVLSNTPYSFQTRFESGQGTNPEELIAAAHAGCFSMACAAELGQKGLRADFIHTTATVELAKQEDGFAIAAIHLDVHAKLPDADSIEFENAANHAKKNCPVSKLMNADITMELTLEI